MIDSINSLSITESFATQPITVGAQKVTIFGVTFTLSAYKDALRIPLRAGTIDPDALTLAAPQLTLQLESKYASTKNTPIILGSIIPHTKHTDEYLTIAPNTKGEATLLIAYAGTPDPDRIDRIRATALPLYVGTSTAPMTLTPSEVQEIVTPSVELGS